MEETSYKHWLRLYRLQLSLLKYRGMYWFNHYHHLDNLLRAAFPERYED